MITGSAYPKNFSRFYDVIYNSIRSGTDHIYFMNKIKQANGPVLEVGVGTGRFFMDALKAGADIYGIDISPEMLKVLKSKINKKDFGRIQPGDFSKTRFDKNFDLIIAPFRVFQHLHRIEEQQEALDNMYRSLKPGGKFIFDLFVPNIKMLAEGLDNVIDFDGEYAPGKRLRRYTSMKADIVNQTSNVTFTLVWDEEGKENREVWKTSLRFFFRYELDLLLNSSSFSKYHIYGDFNESLLSTDSKEFIVVCEK
ncbi:MAG: class I SAM-dependent methyltransferase [Bacteroidales bacterium]|nr:class I SAM-dependent methyltransferase [Bacteroidales bacterium]MCF8405253.1 class I SAM-dependent methyltransferase [Bacteroidales bacterium]